jgi:hypothetical protein
LLLTVSSARNRQLPKVPGRLAAESARKTGYRARAILRRVLAEQTRTSSGHARQKKQAKHRGQAFQLL